MISAALRGEEGREGVREGEPKAFPEKNTIAIIPTTLVEPPT